MRDAEAEYAAGTRLSSSHSICMSFLDAELISLFRLYFDSMNFSLEKRRKTRGKHEANESFCLRTECVHRFHFQAVGSVSVLYGFEFMAIKISDNHFSFE